MSRRSRSALFKGALLLFALIALSGVAFSYWVGGELVAPRLATVGPPPTDLRAEPILIAGNSSSIHGWWIKGDKDKGSVLLLHGIRANRTAMVGRARTLASHGYSVLLIDLQAHGESPGDAITLGLRESIGVRSARDWIRAKRPDRPIAVVGVSLGGASVLLGPSPKGFDAIVLEAVYPDARRALQNRMAMRFGAAGPLLSKLLEVQVEPRLGVSLGQLRPIDHIAIVDAPVLIVAGGKDRHTTLAESKDLFDRAKEPKELWVLAQATHQDFQRFDPQGYEDHVIGFLQRRLPLAAATSTSVDIARATSR